MLDIKDEEFDELINLGIKALPKLYRERIDNVVFIVEDEPTQQQRMQLNLYPNETLFGLYEGVPLPARGGVMKLIPDKITIFKIPALMVSRDESELKEHIRHTIWHEVAHYYGLDHERIHALERKVQGRSD
jgi:predicted Zn-dependent protease with MMP-like domain